MVQLDAVYALAYIVREGHALLTDSLTRPPCPILTLIHRYANCEGVKMPACTPEQCGACKLRCYILAPLADEESRVIE
jgi:hypothetical protein